jgi:hypothetical protein
LCYRRRDNNDFDAVSIAPDNVSLDLLNSCELKCIKHLQRGSPVAVPFDVQARFDTFNLPDMQLQLRDNLNRVLQQVCSGPMVRNVRLECLSAAFKYHLCKSPLPTHRADTQNASSWRFL